MKNAKTSAFAINKMMRKRSHMGPRLARYSMALTCPPPLAASPRPGLLNSSRTTTSCVTLTVSNSRTFIIRMIQSGDQRPSYSAKMRPEGLLLISPKLPHLLQK